MYCEYCGKLHDGSFGSGRFCSISCLRSFVNSHRKLTLETKAKISNTLKSKKQRKLHKCIVCGKEFHKGEGYNTSRKICSLKCRHIYENNVLYYKELNKTPEEILLYHLKLSEAGKHSVVSQAEIRRSKNEIAFCKLCEEKFEHVTHNDPMFNGWDADVLIHDLKIAILWNGIWHYKKVKEKHSVEQVQSRDKIKQKEIENFGWNCYIIKDTGKYNLKFVEEQFKLFLTTI